MSDDLPQRRKSTLEFVLLSIINALEHLLIVPRDLSEEEGKGKQQPILEGRPPNHLDCFSNDTYYSPFLELLISFSREFSHPTQCQIPFSGENLNKGTIVINGNI